MHCTIGNKYLKSIQVLAQPLRGDNDANNSVPVVYLRICAADGKVVMTTPYGEVEIPSNVTVPGVLFIPAPELLGCIANVRTQYWIEIDVNAERARIADSVLCLDRSQWKLFATVEEAPTFWRP